MRTWAAVILIAFVNLVALPLTLILMMTCASAVSPMQTGFLTTVEIRNLTDQTVCVTPVGATESGAQRVLLPTYRSTVFAWSRFPYRDEPLAAGACLTVIYDWDDCVLSEVVVRRGTDDLRQVVVRPFGPAAAPEIRHPGNDVVAISGADQLPTAAPHVVAALNTIVPWWAPPDWLLLLGPAVHAASFVLVLRWIARSRRVADA